MIIVCAECGKRINPILMRSAHCYRCGAGGMWQKHYSDLDCLNLFNAYVENYKPALNSIRAARKAERALADTEDIPYMLVGKLISRGNMLKNAEAWWFSYPEQ